MEECDPRPGSVRAHSQTETVFTLVTRVKIFDVMRVDVRNGLYRFLTSSIGSDVKLDINSEILTSTSTLLTPTTPMKTPQNRVCPDRKQWDNTLVRTDFTLQFS